MCGVKTENITVNVSREEGSFWRTQTARFKARSRGEFQKYCMALGLAALSKSAAKKLRSIRRQAAGANLEADFLLRRSALRPVYAAFLLCVFLAPCLALGQYVSDRCKKSVRRELHEAGDLQQLLTRITLINTNFL